MRVDIRCPTGTTQLAYSNPVDADAVKGWSTQCEGSFTTGAGIVRVVEV